MSTSKDSFKHFLDQLEKIDLVENYPLYKFEGFWYGPYHLEAIRSIQSHFVAKDDDIILASSMKTGSQWLKALVYCIMGPKIADGIDDPLFKNNPSVLVPTLELQTYLNNPNPDLSVFPSPRILHTHMSYVSLPDSVKNSRCKIVYIVRNPKDVLVSMYHFFNEVIEVPLDVLFEKSCDGVLPYGPFFEHALQYWNESLKSHQKVLFLKYEDLKKDTKGEVRKLASFLGKSLDDDEEIDKVIWKSSFERLKNLDVNKNGHVLRTYKVPNNAFFRLGVVGDWKDSLTSEMNDRIDQITMTKLEGSGLYL